MNLFFISVMPLIYWAVQSLFENTNVSIKDILLPFIYGVVVAVPVILLYWAMDVYFFLSWNPAGLYFYTLLNKEGFIFYPLTVLLAIVFRKKDDGTFYLREFFGLFCGYFFLISSIELMTGEIFSVYDLLLLPLVRFITLSSASVLLNRLIRSSGRVKYYYGAALFLLPLILNFLILFEYLNKAVLFYLIFIPVLLMAAAGPVLETQNKIPG